MKCKQIDLGKAFCSESALDGVSKLVAKGFNITKACEVVAVQYAENYPDEAPKSAKQLRKKYYDAQKTDKPVKAPKKKEDVPIVVDNITMEQEIEINTLKIRVLELETSNEELVNTMLDQEAKEIQQREEISQLKEQLKGYQPQVDVITTTPTGQILREVVYSFIEKYGNANQMKALEVFNLSNEKMFELFKAVRANVLKDTPPQMLPKEITEATEII